MKTVHLSRGHKDKHVTLGMLQIEGLPHKPIYTLENPWLDNTPWKSCIPSGDYECAPYDSPKYPRVFQVRNVPDRTYILFHSGNYERNTKGCILLGMGAGDMNGEPAVLNSRKAVRYFKDLIGDEKFTLKIGD